MDIHWPDYLWTVLFFAAGAWIVGRFLFQPRRIAQFPAFFGYAIWQIGSAAAVWGLYWAQVPWLYSFNRVVQVLTLATVTAVLIEIYFVLKRRADWSHWIALLVFTLAAAVLARGPMAGYDYYYGLITVFMLFNCALAVMVQLMRLRSRRVSLGRSYSRILFGLSLMLAFQTFLYVYGLLDLTPWPWLVALAQPISLAGWPWYIAALQRVELPARLDLAEEEEELELSLVNPPGSVVAK
ncbi:MAG TPA: hypothetical protein VLU25_14855 [Acidobacteriota bacterium]|nr:hypothetical protein [Acidobacteriota bacterium]